MLAYVLTIPAMGLSVVSSLTVSPLTASPMISIGPYDFNGFDTAVLGLLLISGLYAFARGFLRETISIIALIIAAIATLVVYGQFRFAVRGMLSPNELADGVLILGTGLLSYLIAAIILAKVGKTIGGESPGLIDRVLGAAFGIARGLLIAALFVMFWSADYRASIEAQLFSEYIEQNPELYPPEVIARMPQSMREQLDGEPEALPGLFENSTFYPLLDRIGDAIRALPFADMRSYAERIKDGDLDSIAQEIRS